MDQIDQAQALAESHLAKALKKERRRLQEERSAASASPDCTDCGEPISPQRRLAVPWARRCHYCQSEAEQASRRG